MVLKRAFERKLVVLKHIFRARWWHTQRTLGSSWRVFYDLLVSLFPWYLCLRQKSKKQKRAQQTKKTFTGW